MTGPTTRQVDDIVWNEIRAAYAQASDRLGGRMFRTSRYELDEQTFALGFATSSPYNLQGFHSPNLMVVLTEAHAVREADVDAVRRLHPARLLMTGNPLVAAGSFYDSHHSKREMYATVQIGAGDTPNVALDDLVIPGMITREDMADRKQDWGETSPLYLGAILGRFPDNLDQIVVPSPTPATRRTGAFSPPAPSSPPATSPGTDTARRSSSGGRDPSPGSSGESADATP